MSDWIFEQDVDPQSYRAFLYSISLPDGRYYVGIKATWVEKGGKLVRPSDWAKYWGSSKDVKAAVKAAGAGNCRREVLTWCVSRGEARWRELEYLVEERCLLDPRCMNGNVAERFQRKVVQGWSDDTRRERYLRDIARQRETLEAEA